MKGLATGHIACKGRGQGMGIKFRVWDWNTPHLGPTTGLPMGVKEQTEPESQACRCRMGRDEEQKGYPAVPQSPLAPAPCLSPKAKLDCGHLLPWRPRLGWGLASDSRPFPH